MTEPEQSALPAEPLQASGPVLERPHPLTPLVRGWIVLVAGLFGFSQSITDVVTGQGELPPWWVIVGIILLVAVGAGLAGLMTWWFTRFVIDDNEVRVETGWLQRRSRRVAFDRIQSVDVDQPLVARLLGLAELRIEAGAGEGATRLQYLQRNRAYTLRDYLLRRAVGQRTTVATVGAGPLPGLMSDESVEDQVLLAMSPERIIGAFLLSAELWVSVGLGLAFLAVGALPLAVEVGDVVGSFTADGILAALRRTADAAAV